MSTWTLIKTYFNASVTNYKFIKKDLNKFCTKVLSIFTYSLVVP